MVNEISKIFSELESLKLKLERIQTNLDFQEVRLRTTLPVYTGNNRALVKLSSGEYLCVETNSIDSIDYLLGFGIEGHVYEIFQRYLKPDAVVLDIGANFGYYSVRAASAVAAQGKLFAFEANPHTFGILKRSAYANGMLFNQNIRLINALVSESNGSGVLYVVDEFLGGASMQPHEFYDTRPIDVPMVTIDDTLPLDLNVDLIKIDVEGFEPYVLKGMEKTLARSSNVRIIIEMFDCFLSKTYGMSKFQDYIRSLDFHICRILPDSSLKLVEIGEILSGDNYCLLTRTPDEDLTRRELIIPLEMLRFHNEYLVAPNPIFEHQVLCYKREIHGMATSVDEIFYGPYINLDAGRYEISFIGELRGELFVSFNRNFRIPMGEKVVTEFSAPVIVEAPSGAENFAMSVLRRENLDYLLIRSITITKTA